MGTVEQSTDVEWHAVTHALTIWPGWDHAPFPLYEGHLVVKHFGKTLLPLADGIETPEKAIEVLAWCYPYDQR